MNFPELYVAVKGIFETAKGVTGLIRGLMNLAEKDPDLLVRTDQDESSVVSRALNRLNLGKSPAPRIAIVGETSVGKTALVNVLFGAKVGAVKLTADTTRSVHRVKFPSNLVIYDTPGIFGDEELENITRLFLGLNQDYEKEARPKEVPFQPSPDPKEIKKLSGKQIREEAPIDLVLWAVNVESTLKRSTRKESYSFFLELERAFGKHLVVVGTHLDRLNAVSDEEKEEQLRGWNEISNNQIIPVSSTEGDGLTDLVKELFKRLPGTASLSKLQESLNQVVKLDRRSFVLTEMSHPLAMLMLMLGDDQEEIKIHVTILIMLICSHYSVPEGTWQTLHGDGL